MAATYDDGSASPHGGHFLDSELLCTARECIKPPEPGLSAQSLGLNVGRPADVITPEPSATAYEPAPISLLV